MACWESDLNINAFVLVLLYLSGLFRCKGGEDRVVER